MGWMKTAPALLLSLLAACAPAAPRRVLAPAAPPVAAPTPVVRPAGAAIAPGPAGWRRFPAPGPAGTPVVAWSHRLDGPVTEELVTDGAHIFVVAAGRVHCFDRKGVERWRSAVGATGAPTVDGARLMVPGPNGKIIVVGLEDGLIQQEIEAGGAVVGATFPVEGGVAWATAGGALRGIKGWSLQASDSVSHGPSSDGWSYFYPTATAELISGQADRVRWRAVLPGPALSSPVVAEGRILSTYAGTQGGPGGLIALSPETGLEIWRTPLDGGPTGGLALGAVLVVGDTDGALVGVDPARGTIRWTAPIDGAVSTAPALGSYGLYVGNADGRLHRFDPDDGGESWSLPLGATVSSGPIVVGDLVVVGLMDGNLVAVGGGG